MHHAWDSCFVKPWAETCWNTEVAESQPAGWHVSLSQLLVVPKRLGKCTGNSHLDPALVFFLHCWCCWLHGQHVHPSTKGPRTMANRWCHRWGPVRDAERRCLCSKRSSSKIDRPNKGQQRPVEMNRWISWQQHMLTQRVCSLKHIFVYDVSDLDAELINLSHDAVLLCLSSWRPLQWPDVVALSTYCQCILRAWQSGSGHNLS